MTRRRFAATLACLPLLAGVSPAHAGPRVTGIDLPAMVQRSVAATVSVTTRQIEHDQFNQPVPVRGLGSGFVVNPRGFVLTNWHVVEGAEQIKVTFSDERVFRAELVGADPFTDLAVLKVDGGKLPALRLGASARLRVGETVVAIGSPLWIEQLSVQPRMRKDHGFAAVRLHGFPRLHLPEERAAVTAICGSTVMIRGLVRQHGRRRRP